MSVSCLVDSLQRSLHLMEVDATRPAHPPYFGVPNWQQDPDPAPASSNRRQFCLTIEVPLEITDDSTCPEWAASSMLRACSSQQQQYYTTARWQHRAHICPGE
ncbi:hypothetical protein QJQ45_022395 [Haematococcus lacustris]|nr:hypothetical protein QJQ45_022395 [Haematococcus lacustris]